jgi:hypothetical protein
VNEIDRALEIAEDWRHEEEAPGARLIATLADEVKRLRAAAVALLDAMAAEGHYSDPVGCDERTERAMMQLSRLVRR